MAKKKHAPSQTAPVDPIQALEPKPPETTPEPLERVLEPPEALPEALTGSEQPPEPETPPASPPEPQDEPSQPYEEEEAPEPPDEPVVKLQPAAETIPGSVYDHLRVLLGRQLNVATFREETNTGDLAISYLQGYEHQGLVHRAWIASEGIYSLTPAGEAFLTKGP